jgi:amyloid beta precursor protein binding protein 1
VSPFSTSDILQLSPEIPTFLVHSLGFTTLFRVAAPTRCIVETHTDSLIDLRLLNPWKELSAFVAKRTESLDVPESGGGMNDYEHGHVPYVLLLLKYLQDWKDLHGGHVPGTYDDKDLLRAMIRDKMRTNVPGGSEENYEEAIAAVLNHVRAVELSSDTKAVLEDQRCIEPTANVRPCSSMSNMTIAYIH